MNKRRELLLRLIIFLLLTTSCNIGKSETLPDLRESSCAQEEISFDETEVQVDWDINLGDGYISDRLFIVNDLLITIDNKAEEKNSTIRALNSRSGLMEWELPNIYLGNQLDQQLDFSEKYIASHVFGKVTIINVEDGRIHLNIATGLIFSLMIYNDLLFVHHFEGYVSSYDLVRGDLIWKTNIPNALRHGALFNRDDNFIISTMINMVILDPEDGSVKKIVDYGSGRNPLIFDDVIIDSSLKQLRAFSFSTGKKLWEVEVRPENEDIIYSGPVYYKGMIYFQAENLTKIKGVDINTGEIHWEYKIEDELFIASDIAIYDGQILVIASDGTVRLYDIETGEEKVLISSKAIGPWVGSGSIPLPVPSIVTQGDKIYLSFGCHKIFAIEIVQ